MSWLHTATAAPPEGAGPLSVRGTVAVAPDVTVDGLSVSAVRATVELGGATVSEAVLTTPPKPASDAIWSGVTTGPACTVKLAAVCPAEIR